MWSNRPTDGTKSPGARTLVMSDLIAKPQRSPKYSPQFSAFETNSGNTALPLGSDQSFLPFRMPADIGYTVEHILHGASNHDFVAEHGQNPF